MDHFNYKNGELYAEDVAVREIAATVGTPFYCYSRSTLTHHYKVFSEGFQNRDTLICFAVKSNSNLAVIKTFAQAGAGADVVSQGEIRRALKAGVAPDKIIFSGIGKTKAEMEFALNTGIYQFNVESASELELLSESALSLGKTANIAIRINPNIDAVTHGKITTGLKTSKFGIDISIAREIYLQAAKLPGIKPRGVSVHIGSQITDFAPFEAAFKRVLEFVAALAESGIQIEVIDLGGGIGVPYEAGKVPPHPREYAAMVQRVFKNFTGRLVFEPGRVLVGNAGILVSEVIYTKKNDEREFLIIDAAMNDLIRPSFYNAHHDIIPVVENRQAKIHKYDIVGPVCETGDTFAELRELAEAKPGDLVAFRTAGAYGSTMASTYNSRPIAPEVMVNGSQFQIISRRMTYEEMFEREIMPKWLEN